MQDVSIIVEATKFMVLGMGIVFSFLLLMILVINIQKVIINRYFPDKETLAQTFIQSSTKEQKVVVAIAGAIRHYTQTKKG